MFAGTDQFSSVARENFESQLAAITILTSKTFESVARLMELNMSTARESFEQSTETAQKLLMAKDVQEFFALSASQAQPSAERMFNYGRNLMNIATSTQVELSKAAEAQLAHTTRSMAALVEDMERNAPPGTENAVAFFRTALGNAHAGYEQMVKTTKQATDTLEENMTRAAKHFSQSSEKTRSSKK